MSDYPHERCLSIIPFFKGEDQSRRRKFQQTFPQKVILCTAIILMKCEKECKTFDCHVTVVVGGRRRGPRCSVVRVHNYLNSTLKNTKTTTWTTETVLSGTDTKQKTTTHNSKAKPGGLSMVLNQRQRLPAASDWEPYQAKHIEIQT